MACSHILLVTVLLLSTTDGIKVVKPVKQSCTVLTDQGTVDLTSVAKTADKQEAA